MTAPTVESLQDAIDAAGCMAGIECPACGNDADFRIDAVGPTGAAAFTCGACGAAGNIASRTAQRLHRANIEGITP
jgi:hypothetical protein